MGATQTAACIAADNLALIAQAQEYSDQDQR